jgi:hypothetical protein
LIVAGQCVCAWQSLHAEIKIEMRFASSVIDCVLKSCIIQSVKGIHTAPAASITLLLIYLSRYHFPSLCALVCTLSECHYVVRDWLFCLLNRHAWMPYFLLQFGVRAPWLVADVHQSNEHNWLGVRIDANVCASNLQY